MAVRLPVRIVATSPGHSTSSRGKAVTTAALANSGFESERCEVALPAAIARRLGLSSRHSGARIDTYLAASGPTRLVWIPEAVRVRVTTGVSAEALCDVAILEGDEEAVLNDHALSALGISLVDVAAGLWCFRGTPAVHSSAPRQVWVRSKRSRRRPGLRLRK